MTQQSSPDQRLSRAGPTNAKIQRASVVASMVSTPNKTAFRESETDITPQPNLVSLESQSKGASILGVHDPIESKDSWSKLFNKPAAPRCDGHSEPCISLMTKKSGINCGRSFWMCPRPLGPSGTKEKGTQWRCQTFIWCSDWNSNSSSSLY